MENSKLRYNERSWAIDLISYINGQIAQVDAIQRAGGELTLSTEDQNLFPDVLLFGDSSIGNVLQGWELKMPDTSIDDHEYLRNAETKARSLGLNSFVVWNAKTAHLYILDIEQGEFLLYEEPLSENIDINTRDDVKKRPDLWQEAASTILRKLNAFFVSGEISGVSPEAIFSNDSFVDQLLCCQSGVKTFIDERMVADHLFDAKVKDWWSYVKNEYPGEDSPAGPLAYCVLLRWFNRFVFSNILKVYNAALKDIEGIKRGTSIEDALNFFSKISQQANFWNVFGPAEFDEMIPDYVWEVLTSFNGFLQQLEFGRIDGAVLQSILKSVVLSSIKEAAGLYVTPYNLARLLVLLSQADKNGITIDPFCGTGTIVKAVLDVKSDYNIPGYQTIQTTWACDKFAFPVQISTLAISSPANMGEPLRIFTHDALTLSIGEAIPFINPDSGKKIEIEMPHFSTIVSNLPFIQFEDIDELNKLVNRKILQFYKAHSVTKEDRLGGRGDFYSYIPFILYELLEDDGYLGIIVSNSWLSTGWGAKFRKLLQKFYDVKYVVASANGKWFSEADVVANLLICQKKNSTGSSRISFVATKENLADTDIDSMAIDVLAQAVDSDKAFINTISDEQLSRIDSLNIGWTSCFADVSWLLDYLDKFEMLSKHVSVARGERRGWNSLFYPSQEHWPKIEDTFLRPVLKTLKGKHNLTISADEKAFCCPYSLDELQEKRYIKAIAWIKQFENKNNTKGKPLIEVLARRNLEWYQMDTNTMADFVLSMNPDKRLFIAKTEESTFVDQRIIRLTQKDYDTNPELLHALLNSSISMFLIEAIGFGRGLSVLDINSTTIRKGFRLPKLDLISPEDANRIMEAFEPLCHRRVLPVYDEIQQVDRQELDKTILRSIGIPDEIYNNIYSSILTMYNIRKSVKT